jgi:hypothetical protein
MSHGQQELPILIAIKDEYMDKFKEVVARLEKKGLRTHSARDAMPTLGIVRGTASADVTEVLKKDEAVATLREEGRMVLENTPPK